MINAPTMEQLNKLPGLYETENIPSEEKIVHLHFILNQSHWWAIEYDGQNTFFGYVLLNGWTEDAEFGYFNLSELLEVKFDGWLEVLHDPFWIPKPMKGIFLLENRCLSIPDNKTGQNSWSEYHIKASSILEPFNHRG